MSKSPASSPLRARMDGGVALNDYEIQLDMEPETVASRSTSLTFNQHTGELSTGPEEVGIDFDIDLKTFDQLELNSKPFNTTTSVQPHNEHFYSTSLPSCSTINDNDGQSTQSDSSSLIKCTGFLLSPPLANPVDMAVEGEVLAIADYENGLHFVNHKTAKRRHHKTDPYRICGVQFLVEEAHPEHTHVVLLAYMNEKWTINVHSWPEFREEYVVPCPIDPVVPPWARRKIKIVGQMLYLLGTSEQCSVIWTLNLPTSAWKTLIVERGRPQTTSLTSTLASTLVGSNNNRTNVYSDFDVQRWSKAESRIVLCEAQRSQLNILVLIDPNQLVDKQTIKVKRRKAEKWIVQGPRMAVWDNERDIVVYDGSGKVFWFDGATYRIRRIVADIGKSEVCAIVAKDNWVFILDRSQNTVHTVWYRQNG